MPIKKPTAAGTKAKTPIPRLLSKDGCSRLQKVAATITPDAKPLKTFFRVSDICFFRNRTMAEPRQVPKNGISVPSRIATSIVMSLPCFFL